MRRLVTESQVALLVKEDTAKAASNHRYRVVEKVELCYGRVDSKKENSQRHDDPHYVRPLEFDYKRPDKKVIEICCVNGCSSKVEKEQVKEAEIRESNAISGKSAVMLW